MQDPQPPALDPFIIRVDTYENERGNRVFHRVLIAGKPPEGFHPFVGVGQVNIPNSPFGPIQQPFNFVIEADSVERAFALFEGSAQAEGRVVLDRIRNDIRRQMTAIQPAPAGALGLLDASGNPLPKKI